MLYIAVVSQVICKNSNDDENGICTVKSRIDLSFAKKKKKAEDLFKDILFGWILFINIHLPD